MKSLDENKIFKCMKIKLIFYFIINILLQILFTYYITVFVMVFENSQKIIFYKILLNWFLSMLFPFILSLIFTIMYKVSIKKKNHCLFYISNI